MRRLSFLLCLPMLLLAAAWAHPRLPPDPPPVQLSGAHWTAISLPATPLGIAAHGNELWVCGWDGLIAESPDGGRTWHIRHFKKGGQLFFALAFSAPDSVYAFGPAFMSLVSRDGGRVWKKWPGPGFAVTHAFFAGPKVDLLTGPQYFAFGSPRQWQTRRAWHANFIVAAAMVDRFRAVLLMSPFSVLRSGALAPGAVHVWRTADGGRHWSQFQLAGLTPWDVAAANRRFWLVARTARCAPALAVSSDGARWQLVKSIAVTGSWCNALGCRDRAGWRPFSQPAAFVQPWIHPLPKDQGSFSHWAAVSGVVCDVGGTLRCALAGAAGPSLPVPCVAADKANTSPPKPIPSPTPGYPAYAWAHWPTGVTELRIMVGLDGRAHDPVLIAAPSRKMALAMIQAASGWRFHPATRNGKPIAAETEIVVNLNRGANPNPY